MSTLNPLGSDAVALASVIAPRVSRVLLRISEWVGIAVALLSASLLVLLVFATQVDHEIVAVTPGGAMLPLVQLEKSNEQAQRALLAATAPLAQPPASPSAGTSSTPAVQSETTGPRNAAGKK